RRGPGPGEIRGRAVAGAALLRRHGRAVRPRARAGPGAGGQGLSRRRRGRGGGPVSARSMHRSPAALVCALLTGLGAVAPPVPVLAQPTAHSRAAVSMGAAPQLINLPRGTSFAVDLPADARDVIVSNPQ